jgi:hypothetical protein
MNWRFWAVLWLLLTLWPAASSAGEVASNCTYNGKKLWGKIQIVDSFPDLKVQVVTAFPDLKVKVVDSFPDDCGEWKMVDSFPDLKIQFVTSFPDIKIQYVESFPGLAHGRQTGPNDVASDCTFRGVKLSGKVRFVEHGEIFSVEFVESNQDVRVQHVANSPGRCGQWRIVENGEDFRVRVVDHGGDVKIRWVTSNPGL